MQYIHFGVIHDAVSTIKSREVVCVNYKHNEQFCKAFGHQVRKVREEKGIPMRQLALLADMEYSQLSKIERGVINTTISTVHAIAVALNIPDKELFDFEFVDR